MSEKSVTVPGFFWADRREWDEVHFCLESLFEKYGEKLKQVKDYSSLSCEGLSELFPLFDQFAEQTCPSCKAICCEKARVAFDFRDLVFLHAADLEIPPHQLRRNDDEHCRYLGKFGCELERIRRPFICTWYYCAPMIELYQALPNRRQRHYSRVMMDVQNNRKLMEEAFISVVTRGM